MKLLTRIVDIKSLKEILSILKKVSSIQSHGYTDYEQIGFVKNTYKYCPICDVHEYGSGRIEHSNKCKLNKLIKRLSELIEEDSAK